MLFIVNGTGPFSDKTYRKEMARSFCWLLHKQLGNHAKYYRGPSVDGFLTFATAQDIVDEIKKLPATEKVFLCGYSRGGAAVIAAAKKVQRPIEALFLFDAVDREAFLRTDTIPPNVAKTYHAIRDPAFNLTYEQAVDLAEKQLRHEMSYFSPKMDMPTFRAGVALAEKKLREMEFKFGKTRTWFGNAGTAVTPPGQLF